MKLLKSELMNKLKSRLETVEEIISTLEDRKNKHRLLHKEKMKMSKNSLNDIENRMKIFKYILPESQEKKIDHIRDK